MERIKEGYARVSDVLAIFQAYSMVPRKALKRAQEAGVTVHEAIEMYFKGEFIPIHPKYIPYFSSFLKFIDKFDPKPVIVEKRFYDENWMITGKVDLIATIYGEDMLVDFKTGSMAHPEIWKLQGSFYRHMCRIPVEKLLFVQLSKEGNDPVIHDFEYSDCMVDVMSHAVKMHRYFSSFSPSR